MNYRKNLRARYVLLLEDDAVVHGKLPMMMSSVTRQLEGRAADVDYVKMYHPRQWRYIPAYPLVILLIICLLMQFKISALSLKKYCRFIFHISISFPQMCSKLIFSEVFLIKSHVQKNNFYKRVSQKNFLKSLL